jgi:hypothetical protein
MRTARTLWILTLCLLALPAFAQPVPARRFALVVGHNIGNHRTLPLQFAEKDADKMALLFRELASVPEANVRLLLGPDAETLRTALAALRDELGAGEGGRTELFFYYSGHADEQGLLLGETLYPLAELRDRLRDSGADVTIAILDACQSGAIVRDKGGKRVPLIDLTGSAEGEARGVAVITSSAATEKSQESDELRGSFFTHFLASGMRGDADSSRDGRVTLHELYQYAYNKTRQRTWTAGTVEQHPTFDYAMTGSGELVVAFPEKGRGRLVLPAALEGNYLLYAPATDSVLAEVEKRAGEVRVLAVPPGTIELFKRTDTKLHKTVLTVADGEEKEAPAGDAVEVSRSYLIDKGVGVAVKLGAKGGYQVFWDAGIRERSLLPSVMGGFEVRLDNLLGRRISPFAEVLVGGAASTTQGGAGPLAQTFSVLEAGAGVAFTLLADPVRIEISPEIALYYAYLSVEDKGAFKEGDPNHYAMASPSLSLLLGKEFGRTFSVALQVKTGYLYFRDSVSDYGAEARHLGFSELFLTAGLRL